MKSKKMMISITAAAAALVITLATGLSLWFTFGVGGKVDAVNYWDGTVATEFAGGNGISASNAYQISTPQQLALMAKYINMGSNNSYVFHYKLTNDIYLNDTTNWTTWDENTTGLKSWIPIGIRNDSNLNLRFQANFDGNGFEIHGLYINSIADYQGFFGYAYAGSIRNVGLVEGFVRGGNYSGSICGYHQYDSRYIPARGLIDNVYSGVTVKATDGAHGTNGSGAVGANNSVRNGVNGSSGIARYVGGIAGYATQVYNSYYYGTVTGGAGGNGGGGGGGAGGGHNGRGAAAAAEAGDFTQGGDGTTGVDGSGHTGTAFNGGNGGNGGNGSDSVTGGIVAVGNVYNSYNFGTVIGKNGGSGGGGGGGGGGGIDSNGTRAGGAAGTSGKAGHSFTGGIVGQGNAYNCFSSGSVTGGVAGAQAIGGTGGSANGVSATNGAVGTTANGGINGFSTVTSHSYFIKTSELNADLSFAGNNVGVGTGALVCMTFDEAGSLSEQASIVGGTTTSLLVVLNDWIVNKSVTYTNQEVGFYYRLWHSNPLVNEGLPTFAPIRSLELILKTAEVISLNDYADNTDRARFESSRSYAREYYDEMVEYMKDRALTDSEILLVNGIVSQLELTMEALRAVPTALQSLVNEINDIEDVYAGYELLVLPALTKSEEMLATAKTSNTVTNTMLTEAHGFLQRGLNLMKVISPADLSLITEYETWVTQLAAANINVLNSEITTANLVLASEYDNTTFTKFKTVRDSAAAVYNEMRNLALNDYQLDILRGLTLQLRALRANLRADTRELQLLVDFANSIDGTKYPASSFAVVESLTETAESLISTARVSNTIKNAQLSTAAANLQNGLDMCFILDELPENEALVAKIAEGKTYAADGYTANSFQRLTSAIEWGELLVTKTYVEQTTIDNAVSDIDEAIENLVDPITDLENAKEELQNEYDRVTDNMESENQDDYTPESWQEYQDAKSEAERVLSESTDADEIRNAFDNLKDAHEDLTLKEQPTEPTDPTDPEEPITVLEQALTSLKAKVQEVSTALPDEVKSNYTTESWQKYSDALAEARTVAEQSTDVEVILLTLEKLKGAYAGLIKITPEAPSKGDYIVPIIISVAAVLLVAILVTGTLLIRRKIKQNNVE